MTGSDLQVKNKRKGINLSQKIEIINKIVSGAANAAICREYKWPNSTVSTIWSDREKYLTVQENSSKFAFDKKTYNFVQTRGRTISSEVVFNKKESKYSDIWTSSSKREVEQSLLRWFSIKRSQNIPISGPILQAKASEFERLHKNQTPKEQESESSMREMNVREDGFTGSNEDLTSNVKKCMTNLPV
ncbi:CENP-B N-terminal DNA-binding domain [Popillia japonica]|uniref:CENP-B N-terminal DNA-binding domain n=1 Tax=Popillia japonica TaxID=7064 RepID=A0AAW1MFR5_POPJA